MRLQYHGTGNRLKAELQTLTTKTKAVAEGWDFFVSEGGKL
jgi:hypothetical protein